MDNESIMMLIERAKLSAEHAYVPYSSYPVGACVLTKDGIIFGGCNIENSSFGASSDAGSVAILKAVSEGHPEIEALALYYNGIDLPYPTGECRQMLQEFSKSATIIVANKYSHESYRMNEIMPFPFVPTEIV
ncbi:MAG: cytidine deaminase [Clostridia bacterium]|jgi:cytidine deaminase|nr:cytidine deaminase [Clostridia bacterium]